MLPTLEISSSGIEQGKIISVHCLLCSNFFKKKYPLFDGRLDKD